MINTIKITVPPVVTKIDDCYVYIYEVIPLKTPKDTFYYVVTQAFCGNIKSKKFPIICKDEKELKMKLEIELSKLKMLRLTLGDALAREVVET